MSIPASFAASSTPTLPARTMISATLAPVFEAIPSNTGNTFASLAGSLPSQSF